MKDVAIVSTGNELVYGSVQDENAYYMSREFFRTDFQVVLHLTAGDVPDDLELCIRQAVGRADVVIVTGGLGSTEDDYTFRVLQRIFDCGARVHEPAYERLKSFLKFMKRRELENDVRMVTVPEGAEVFDNEYGLAPGYAIRHGEKIIIAMPGVPREMQLMFDGKVLPFLLWEHQAGVRENFFLRVVLMRESEVNELIKKMDLPFDEMTWGVTAVPGMNNISFVKRGAGRLDRWAIMSEARRVFKDRLLDPDSESLEMELVKLLTEASATIGVAESCTGGLIAKRITDVPGSSAVFRGGVVAYGNEAKIEILDVSAATLQRCGAVSEEVAGEMAAAARKRFGTDIGISASGVAGPGGGTDEKPVGMVCFGFASPKGVDTFTRYIKMDRERVRFYASQYILDKVRLHFKNG